MYVASNVDASHKDDIQELDGVDHEEQNIQSSSPSSENQTRADQLTPKSMTCPLCKASEHAQESSCGHQSPDTMVESLVRLVHDHPNVLDTSKGYEGRCKKVGQYLLGCTIGEGSYGKVRLGKHLITKQQVAVKVVAKKTLVQREAARRHFRREALMLQRIQHPHVTRLYQALETGNSYYLVFELATGGSLLDVLSRKGIFSECESRFYMRQIVSALDHLHKSDIVHRDLKLENILLDENSNVKLVDFGLSAVCLDSTNALSTQCGSPLYAAPELFAGRKYGKPVDVWSMGVCLYALLMGRLPFLPGEGASLLQLYSLVLKGCDLPQHLSQPCKDLLCRMLEVHESRRITLDEMIVHPWLTGPEGQTGAQLTIKRVPPVPKKLSELTVDQGIVKYMCTMFRFSERDVIASVTERKLTPAGATYQILHDSIEAGRMSVSFSKESKVTGTGPSLPLFTAADRYNKTAGVSSQVNPEHPLTCPNENMDVTSSKTTRTGEISKTFEQNGQTTFENQYTRGEVTQAHFKSIDMRAVSRSDNAVSERSLSKTVSPTDLSYQNRAATSASTDSGVGVELLPDETRVGLGLPVESPINTCTSCQETNDCRERQCSYKKFIMGLKQCRQKSRYDFRLPEGCADNARGHRDRSANYVLVGHSPRNENIVDERVKSEIQTHRCKDTEHHLHTNLLPAVSAPCKTSSFSPSFPPIAINGPNSHSSSASSVYSTISGLGQQCINYNSFISSNGGSFYYSSKPIPGFRHGNRYFLHLDKSNFTAYNLGVSGVQSSLPNHKRISCDSVAPRSPSHHNAALGHTPYSKHFVGSNGFYLYKFPQPPSNSSSITPCSYFSEENAELKEMESTNGADRQMRGSERRSKTQNTQEQLVSSINDSSLHVQSLTVVNNNVKGLSSFYGNSGLHDICGQADGFGDTKRDHVSSLTCSQASLQQQRRPVHTLSSLRDIYGADSWRRSKSERADLSRAVKAGLRHRLDGRARKQKCELAPTISNPDFARKGEQGTPRKRLDSKPVKSKKRDKLSVPDRDDDGDSSSTLSRSGATTPVTPEREDFMMPVTSVTITTIGRH